MNQKADQTGLALKLRDGIDRIGLVLRQDLWAASQAAGVNPVQAQVLALLASRRAVMRQKAIAAHLGVSAASIADTLAALERKGLVTRQADAGDARAVLVRATEAGLRLAEGLDQAASRVAGALAALPPVLQEQVLLAEIALIRHLQGAGAIPMQRMCPSCRYFRAASALSAAPVYHCEFVNAAIAVRDLRLDCGEHEAADPSVQAATWAEFEKGVPTLQAQP